MSNLKLDRIRQLKEARTAAFKDNTKEIATEKRIKRLQQVKNRNDQVIKPTDYNDTSDDKTKLLNYSIEQTDKWNEKLEKKRKGKGFENYNQVAAQTYNKEIMELPVDKKSYLQQKQSEVLDLNHTPSKEASDQLNKSLKENDARKMKKRRKNNESTDAYINQRNRDFNQKLERQYGSSS